MADRQDPTSLSEEVTGRMNYIFSRLEKERDVFRGNKEELSASRGRLGSSGGNVECMDLDMSAGPRAEWGGNKQSVNYDPPSPQSHLIPQPPTGNV